MTHTRRMMSILLALVVIPLLAETNAKSCGTFGHACFGGYGKRAQTLDDRDQPLDSLDYKTIQIFRQLCSLPPEKYMRMVPIFRRLVETYNTAAEEATTRK